MDDRSELPSAHFGIVPSLNIASEKEKPMTVTMTTAWALLMDSYREEKPALGCLCNLYTRDEPDGLFLWAQTKLRLICSINLSAIGVNA